MRFVGFLICIVGAVAGETRLVIETETLKLSSAEARDFGGVGAVVFTSKDGSIEGEFSTPGVEAELWARVYFPWAGQDTIRFEIDGQKAFVYSQLYPSRTRPWDKGNYQVWYWALAGRFNLKPGRHSISIKPLRTGGQRIDKVVLYWGKRPAWTEEWLCGELALLQERKPRLRWDKTPQYLVEARDFTLVQGSVERLGLTERYVAVLEKDSDRAVLLFQNSQPREVQIWVRVFFDAKNMFEGLTMEEFANNFYVVLDGALIKTVYEQNGKIWHWVRAPKVNLDRGSHLLVFSKTGERVRIERVVLYAGEDAQEQDWFKMPYSDPVPFGLEEEEVFRPERAGGWLVRGELAQNSRIRWLGIRLGPASYPVEVRLPSSRGRLILEEPLTIQTPPARVSEREQFINLWVSAKRIPELSVIYFDSKGEAFLQKLEKVGQSDQWSLFSAQIPLCVAPEQNVFFDWTGYVVGHSTAPKLLSPQSISSRISALSESGDGIPDYPLAIRYLIIEKRRGREKLVLGKPFFDSPLEVRPRLIATTQSGEKLTAEVAVELTNTTRFPRRAKIFLRAWDYLEEVRRKNVELALYEPREVEVPANGRASLRELLSLPTNRLCVLSCRVGQGKVSNLFIPTGAKGSDLLGELERRNACYRFSPDGKDKQLKKKDGSPIRRDEVSSLYRREFLILDNGVDVCSREYADIRGWSEPLRAVGWDLTDSAGWPETDVPYGVLAIDPTNGRFKFALEDHSKLEVLTNLYTGFGVPGPPVKIRGNFAYVGPGEGHYTIVDISNKRSPQVVSIIPSWYFSSHILFYKHYAYFETSHRSLILVDDLSNPCRPGRLRNVSFDRDRFGRLSLVIEEADVGVSSGGSEGGLSFFDLSEPLYPRFIGSLKDVAGIFRVGDRALTYTPTSIKLIDLSNPRKPKLLPGELPRQKDRKGKSLPTVFALSSRYLALRDGKKITLYRINLRRSLKAEKLAELDVPKGCGKYIFGAFNDNYFYLLDGKLGPGQYSLSWRSPKSRWFAYRIGAGSLEQTFLYEHHYPSAFGNITIEGKYAYVSDYNYGMWIFDLNDPAKPQLLGGAVTAGESDGLSFDGNKLYMWQTFGGAVFIIDISNPARPQRLGEYWDGAWLPYGGARRGNYTIDSSGDYLYVPRQRRGVLVVDTTDPAEPRVVGDFLDRDGNSLNVGGDFIDVVDDRAYLIARFRRGMKLLIYDISDPAKPSLITSFPIPSSDLLCKSGKLLYLGNRKGGFSIIDLQEEKKPSVLSTLDLKAQSALDLREYLSGIAVGGGYAYCTARGKGRPGPMYIHIIDVRNPSRPKYIKSVDPFPDLPDAPCSLWGDFYQDIILEGDYLFIGNYIQVECISIVEPENPRLLDYKHIGYQWSVGKRRGEYLFVPALTGLVILKAPHSSQAPVGKLKTKATF